MKKRIYLSGPISGIPKEIAEAQFDNAYQRLKQESPEAYVVNPLKDVPHQLRINAAISPVMRATIPCYTPIDIENWSDCMRIALDELTFCHEIHMLPGWQQSEGAKLEHHIALALGMPATYPEGEEPNPEPANLTDLATEFTAWSRTAFPEADWGNSLDKLSQEIDEVWEATTSESDHGIALELADCLMCIFDSAARLGINSQMLTNAFAQKLEENKQRQWQRNEDGTYSHVK